MTGLGPLPSSSTNVGSDARDAGTDSGASTRLVLGRAVPLSSAVPSAPFDFTAGSIRLAPLPTPPSRIYSPSETEDWLTCPVWRQFKKSWTPRELDWDPARALGIAVQEGLNVWLRAKREGAEAPEASIQEAVESSLTSQFQEQPQYTLPGLLKVALRGVEAVLATDLFDRHRLLMVDEPLSASRPDVVSRHETEGLGVTDFKVSQRVDERYRASRLSAYETKDQFWHYAWEVGETLGEPVKWLRPILVILTPKAVVLTESVRVTPERLQFWLEGAEQHWRDMAAEDRGERVTAPRWPSCREGRFGPCAAYDFCHVLGRDAQRATVYYDRKEG